VFHEDRRNRSRPVLVALGLAVAVSGVAAAASFLENPKHRLSPLPSPSAQPGPFTVTALQVPPAGRALIWFRDAEPSGSFFLRATDWSGRAVGRLAVSCAACQVLVSPDGQRLMIGDQDTAALAASTDQVFDASGRRLSAVNGFQAQWSDDSRHLCALASMPPAPHHLIAAAELQVTDVSDGFVRDAAQVQTVADPTRMGSWSLLRCAVSADRAVLAYSYQGVRAVRVIRISNGATVLSLDEVPAARRCGCPVANLVVSGDMSLAVENLAAFGVREIDLGTGRETAVPATWNGQGSVLALSWNGRLAVTPIGVYAFPGGQPLWQVPLPAYMLPVSSQPRGEAVLLSLWVSSAPSGRPVIVRGDGTNLALPAAYLTQPPLPF